MDIDDLPLTAAERALFDLAQTIPEGRWSSYGDIAEGLHALGAIDGPVARGASSLEDNMRVKGNDTFGGRDEDILWALGYPWHRVRNQNGELVYGGIGRPDRHIATADHVGNVRLKSENPDALIGGAAKQEFRFQPGPVQKAATTSVPMCHECFNLHGPDEECY